MDSAGRVSALLADDAWRYAIMAGLASIPFTVLLQSYDVGIYVLSPVIAAGILVGYAGSDQQHSLRAGLRTGLIGGLALLWQSFQFATLIPETLPTLFGRSVALVAVVSVIVIYILMFGVFGRIGSMIGQWVAKKQKSRGSSVVG